MLALLKIIKKYIVLEFVIIKYCIRREMEFRFNFVITFLTVVVYYFTNLATYTVIFYSVDNIGGWSFPEIAFLIGTCGLIDGVFMSCNFFNLSSLPALINNGDLDYVLLKPVNSMFLVSFRRFDLGTFFGNTAIGMVLIIASLPDIREAIDVSRIPVYLAMVANSVIILYSIFFIIKCLAFYFIKIEGLDCAFWSIYEFGRRVPGTIYSAIIRTTFTFIVPVLVIAFFPSGYILRKLDTGEVLISFGIACVLLLLAIAFWKCSLR